MNRMNISFTRLTDKIVRDWYIDYLRSKGCEVEFWDVAPLLFGDIKEPTAIQTDYLRIIESYNGLEKLLETQDCKNTSYIIIVTYEDRFNRFFRMLNRYQCRMYFFEWGNLPIGRKNYKRKLQSVIVNPLKYSRLLIYKAIALISRKLHLTKPFDVVFAAGYASMRLHPNSGRVIPVNLFDYDNYRTALQEPTRLVNGAYAVFPDINLPYHTDLKVYKMAQVNPERYFNSLNRFFSIIEKKFAVKIVIAGYPKAEYKNDTFQGREIYKGVTPLLIKDAEFVISQQSTSLCYAVLNCKPLIFIYTNEMKYLYKDIFVSWIKDFANYLDAPLYNVDEVTNNTQICIGNVNFECYKNYKYNYLTTRESEHTTTKEIFWRELAAP